VENERVQICRVYAKAGTPMHLLFSVDAGSWTANTAVQVEVEDPDGNKVGAQTVHASAAAGSALQMNVSKTGFHSFFAEAANTPQQNRLPAYRARVTYTAPQTL
jgi:hypothetical protein